VRQEVFEQRNTSLWRELEALLDPQERRKAQRTQEADALAQLPRLYRQVCNHYALARSRRYSPALVAQLHERVLRGHRQVYRHRDAWLWRFIAFVGADFPRAVRAHAIYFWFSAVLFFGSAVLVGGFCYSHPDLIYSVLDENQVAEMENMYDPANRRPGRPTERSSETDFVMFGFYISNNIGIGFRTFAGGILYGVGTVLILLFNGLVIGGVAGHLTRLGYHATFWPFVAGHGALELTAIVICGAAGLLLAKPVVAPRHLRRAEALRRIAPEALKLVLGAALMLVLAAFVEAFWSSSSVAPVVKYTVAALLWLAVIAYLGRVGGGRRGSR
jgi:uncharacterized membrane protein SpoIIM required for sporulation